MIYNNNNNNDNNKNNEICAKNIFVQKKPFCCKLKKNGIAIFHIYNYAALPQCTFLF